MTQHYSHPNQETIYAGLFKAYANGDTGSSLLAQASALIGNPILLLHADHRILMHSRIEDITDPYWIDPVQRMECPSEFLTKIKAHKEECLTDHTIPAYEVWCEESQNKKLIAALYQGQSYIGSLVIMGLHRPILKEDYEIAETLAKFFSILLSQSQSS